MNNNENIQRLIITDNKTMAVTLAKYFDYTTEDEATTYYDGGTDEVLWTGGNFLKLVLNNKTVAIQDLVNMSAEEITKACYNVVPRTYRGSVSHLDALRLDYIENALSYCDEIVFVCQPTDEGERLIQAIKLFFDIQLPMRTVVCEELDSIGIDEAVERDIRSQCLISYQSAKAMRDNVLNDMLHSEVDDADEDNVSPKAMMLLKEIADRLDLWDKGLHNPELKRSVKIGGIMDIEKLYCVMNTKYDMPMNALWQSLLYLYGIGNINNPMTHLLPSLYDSDYFGEANPGYSKPIDSYRKCVSHWGGVYPIKNEPGHLPDGEYNCDDALEDFMLRTAAIYKYIFSEMERMENREEPERIYFPSYKEGKGLTIFEVLRFAYDNAFTENSNSIRDSFGSLMDELEYAQFIRIRKGYVTMTPFGYQAIRENGEA